MFDWITAMIPCKINPLNSDKIIKVRSNGEIMFEMDCSVVAESSYSDKVTVRCISRGTYLDTEKANVIKKMRDAKLLKDYPYYLRIDGNPSKWFQGHNVDGVFDLALCTDFLIRVCDLLKVSERDVYTKIILGDFRVTRIDVTFSYQLRDLRDVTDWIRSAAECFHSRYQGVKLYGASTLMVGVHGDGRTQVDTGKLKGSRRSILKIYAKGAEVKLKEFLSRFDLPAGQRLYDYAQTLLRVECCFRGMYLKQHGLNLFRDLTEGKLMELFLKKRDALELPENIELPESHTKRFKARQLGVYELWLTGVDLRGRFAKQTLSRYAREFKSFGINLYAPPRNLKRNNVIPMFKVLEACPAVFPRELNHLIYEPNIYSFGMLKAVNS